MASGRGPRVVRSEVEPRLVERRRAVAAAAQRRRRRRSIGLLVGLGALMITVALAFSPLFSVDEVRVAGLDRLDAEQVLALAGVEEGAPMLLVDLGGAREALAADPMVASAAIEREWPRTVALRVVEEQPLALVVHGDIASVVAEGGRVLDAQRALDDGGDASELVRVVTDAPVELRVGEWLEGPTSRVVSMVRQMSVGMTARVEEVRLTPAGSVELHLDRGEVVLVGPPEDVPAKLLAAETVLERVVEECLAVIDVRDPTRAAVSRSEGCEVPGPTDEPTDEPTDAGLGGVDDDPGAAG